MGGGASKRNQNSDGPVVYAAPVSVLVDPPPLPRDGLTITALQQFIDNECGGRAALHGLSTAVVWQQFIYPAVKDWDMAYTDMLKELEFDRKDVDAANVFVCHCWQNEFLTLFDMLQREYGDVASSAFLWIDVFCYNQLLFMPAPIIESAETASGSAGKYQQAQQLVVSDEAAAADAGNVVNHSVEWWCTVMKPFISGMQQVLVLLSPWDRPLLLQDTRCVWELSSALSAQHQQIERDARRKKKYRDLMLERSNRATNAMREAAADGSSDSDAESGGGGGGAIAATAATGDAETDSDDSNGKPKEIIILPINFRFSPRDADGAQQMQDTLTAGAEYVEFLLQQRRLCCCSKRSITTISAQQQKLQAAIARSAAAGGGGGHRRCDRLIADALRRFYVRKAEYLSARTDDAAAKEQLVAELLVRHQHRDEQLHRALVQQGAGISSDTAATTTTTAAAAAAVTTQTPESVDLNDVFRDSKEDILRQLRDNEDLLRVALLLCEECVRKRKKFSGYISVESMHAHRTCSQLHTQLQQHQQAVDRLEEASKICDRLTRQSAAAESIVRIAGPASRQQPQPQRAGSSNTLLLSKSSSQASLQRLGERQRSLQSMRMDWKSSRNPSLLSIPRLQSSDSFLLDCTGERGLLHPDGDEALEIKEQLAAAYCRNAQYAKAIALLKRCQEGWVLLHGVGHERSLRCMMQLAAVYVECKYFEEARVIYSTGMEKAAAHRGSNSRFAIDFIHKLALLYIEMQSLDKALALMNQCLAKERVVYSAAVEQAKERITREHAQKQHLQEPQEPSAGDEQQQQQQQHKKKKGGWGLFSLFTAEKTAEVAATEDEALDVTALAEAAVDMDEKLTMLRLLVDTARLFHRLENAVMALPLYEEAMQLSLRVNGGSDSLTVQLVESLLKLYTELNLVGNLLQMYERYHSSLSRQIGSRHRDTLQCMNNLGYLYMKHGQFEEAEKVLTECVKLRRQEAGLSHPDTLISMHNLGNVYLQMQRYADAYKMFLECLFLRRNRLGLQHQDTQDTRDFLAHICRNVYNREFQEYMELKPLASVVPS